MNAQALRWRRAALRVQFSLLVFACLCRKAGFNPDQPRDEQGRWADTSTSEKPVEKEPFPQVPSSRPSSAQLRNKIIKEVAKWALKVALRETVLGPVTGTILNAIEIASWLQDGYPYIRSYLDAPGNLDELQQAVSDPQKGYDIHHIVEQTAADRSGFPRSMIDAPENLVRIPSLKHREITGWYMTRDEDYDGMSPREYLQDKDWNTRRDVGLYALRRFKVLEP